MATIIQKYGPIYGEAVNGTVQGRPNGSVYVPISNTIELNPNSDSFTITIINDTPVYQFRFAGHIGFSIHANAQDLSSNIETQVFSDAECTNLIATRSYASGIFNFDQHAYFAYGDKTTIPEIGETVYIRAQIMNNNTPVATSTVFDVSRYA